MFYNNTTLFLGQPNKFKVKIREWVRTLITFVFPLPSYSIIKLLHIMFLVSASTDDVC